MKKLVLCAALFVAAGCTGGLPLGEGNAYLCDPAQRGALTEQDKQCPRGWVCGIAGRCIVDEGDVLPLDMLSVTFADGGGARVYPHASLSRPYRDVAAIAVDAPEVYALTTDARSLRISGSSVVADNADAGEVLDVAHSPTHSAAIIVNTVTGTPAPDLRRNVVVVRHSDRQPFVVQTTNALGNPVDLSDAWALRGAAEKADGGLALYIQRQRTEQSVVDPPTGEVEWGSPLTFRPFRVPLADGGVLLAPAVADARPLPRSTFEKLGAATESTTPLALTNLGFFYRRAKGPDPLSDTWINITAPEEDIIPYTFNLEQDPPRLRTDFSQTVFAVSFGLPGGFSPGDDANQRRHTVLSTWRYQRTATGGTAARTFGDCSPCGRAGFIGLMAPTLENGVVHVDVVCDVSIADGGFVSRVVRVSGSAGNDPKDSCAFSELRSTVDPDEVGPTTVSFTRARADGTAASGTARVYPFADYLGGGLVLGGEHGQIWRGRSFDDLQPMFLDRVPDDISTMNGKPFAIAASYAAKHSEAGLAVIEQRAYKTPNGELILPRSAPSDPSSQAAGWVVLSGGELAKVVPSGGNIDVSFGSPLINSAGSVAGEPYFVERVTYENKPRFIIGAFDSIYSSSDELTPQRGELPALAPVLTPAPGAAIRSFVMDRSTKRVNQLAPEGKPMALGYLVAGSTLFRVTMTKPNGVAERWVAEPIDLAGGEPIKVFMRADPDPQAFGRVGMRDGRVFSLPSAVQLTSDLTASLDSSMQASASSARAVSFASIAGLPVLLSEDGLWSPVYRSRSSNYSWQLKPLPAELASLDPRERRQRLQAARIHVATEGSEQVLYLFTDFGFVYKLATAPVTP